MSDTRVRFVEFERGAIDMETGEFPMTLATDGEASDGDILSIEGAQFTSRAPLQLSHINDPTATLGSVSGFRRDLQSSPKRLKARGQIELTGEGPNADIRRDLAHMIQQGHVTGVSVRWEPLKWTPRAQLPKEHPAYVDENEKDWRKRHGVYHERWRVLEGSVVAIQADKAAMIGRAEQTEGAVSEFWRAMADDAKERAALELQGVPVPPVEPEPPAPDPTPEPEPAPPSPEAMRAAFAAQVRELRERGLSIDDLADVIEEQRPPAEPTLADALRTISSLQERLAALEAGRVSGSPSEPQSVAQMLRGLIAESDAEHQQNLKDLRAYIEAQRGRVLSDAERAAAARIRERIEQELRS